VLTNPTQEAVSPTDSTSPLPPQKLPSTRVVSGFGLLLLAALALVTLTNPWWLDDLWRSGSAGSSGVTTVQLSMSGFRPKAIDVKAGTEVRLRLVNAEEGYEHELAIDELGLDYMVQPGSEQVISFTPTTPGSYTFYCEACCGGKGNPSMRGKLTVSA